MVLNLTGCSLVIFPRGKSKMHGKTNRATSAQLQAQAGGIAACTTKVIQRSRASIEGHPTLSRFDRGYSSLIIDLHVNNEERREIAKKLHQGHVSAKWRLSPGNNTSCATSSD